jgi:hypothetical protein
MPATTISIAIVIFGTVRIRRRQKRYSFFQRFLSIQHAFDDMLEGVLWILGRLSLKIAFIGLALRASVVVTHFETPRHGLSVMGVSSALVGAMVGLSLARGRARLATLFRSLVEAARSLLEETDPH